jgi:soluble lytic murein transglycosylase-like protein
VVTPPAPVRLTKDERAIARYITRSYRVASSSVDHFVHYAFKAAREFRLDPHLILAVMAVESSFDPNAQSPAGAQGLMQVHTKVHTSKFEPFGGAGAAYDPLANIKVGARILSEYVNRYGDVAAGLKAYVGAALLESDGGYGSKVLSRQAEFDAVVRPEAPPAMAAKADTGTAPAASTEASGTPATRRASVGL